MAFLETTRMRAWTLALVVGLFSCFVGSAAAQSPEYKLKAAYLCHFVDFVDWPDGTFTSDNSPVIIGVLGADPFGDVLTEVADSLKSKGRSLQIEHFKSADQAAKCQILFVTAAETPAFNAITARLRNLPVLTVGDSDDFLERGGMIRFVREANKIRFRINLATTRAAHLTISSRLLQLAQVVQDGPNPK